MKYVTIYHGENGEIGEENIVVNEFTDWELKNFDDSEEDDIVAFIPLSKFAHLLPYLTKEKPHYVKKIEIKFETDDGEDDSEEFEVGDCENFDEGSLPWSREIVKIKVLE